MDVEWLILADAAQIVGGKLYLMGGGWDVLTANAGFPVQQRCTIAAAFTIPWHETNRPHDVDIEITDGDGAGMGTISGKVEVGRPPGLPQGSDQRAQLTAEMPLTFQVPGTYVIIARVNGEEGKRVAFRVAAAPGASNAQP